MKLKFFIWVTYLFHSIFGKPSTKKVYFFEIDDMCKTITKTEKAIKEATAEKADILLRLNTFGGELESADKIRVTVRSTYDHDCFH